MPLTEPTQTDWDAWFEAAEQLFRQGQFSTLWAKLQSADVDQMPDARRPRAFFYQFTCALYGIGDLDAARQLNQRLDFRFHPTIRYRLCLRLGDFATARRLRKDHDYSEHEQADFRYTLGLHCLARHKYGFGFPLYQERYRAINTPKSLMAPLHYHYLGDDPASDPPTIVLEQGMGEVLVSLLHLLAEGHHGQAAFCGMPKYRRLVRRYFPEASYHSRLDPEVFANRPAIMAMDVLGRAWRTRRSLAPPRGFDTPLRTRHSRPVFGICWRGGSAQNRREERHIPLPFFVQFLPPQYDYVVLQYDVSDEEKAFLRAHPHIQVALLDLSADALATFDLIRELAGVISVAGANWHLAGGAGIPLLALMHGTPHWLWGKPADAHNIYPSATTLAKDALSLDTVDAWIESALAQWPARPVRDPAPATAPADRPIFVTGLPGVGLARVMQQLAGRGLWVGTSAPAETSTAVDAYDNPLIQQRLIFNILRKLDAHEDGVVLPPPPERLPPFPWLRFQIDKALRESGWDGMARWALKDFRLALLWPMFARACPDATWVVVTQDPEALAQALIADERFARHSTSREYWKMYLNVLEERIATLCRSGERVVVVADEADPARLQAQLGTHLGDILDGPAPA